MSQRYSIVFPGQGAQHVGMGTDLLNAYSEARRAFDDVSEAIGTDVERLCTESDEETLRQTQNAQVALFTVSLSAYGAVRTEVGDDLAPVALAGHSIGEYAALVCGGWLSVTDGARLVQRRGELMASAGQDRPGTMAAVLGLDDETTERVCSGISRDGHAVVPANYNSPGQIVISGDGAAVSEACDALKDAGAKRCLPLSVSGAFHSPLMFEAAREMRQALNGAEFKNGDAQVVSNVTAAAVSDASELPSLLERQLASPVKWTQSVRTMREMGSELFVECGPGEVLTSLLKRIDRDASGASARDPSSAALAALAIEGAVV